MRLQQIGIRQHGRARQATELSAACLTEEGQVEDSGARATSRLAATANSFYRPELDGLRFFAFLSVYITHTVAFGSGTHHHLNALVGDLLGTIGSAGNFGVDLFFTLSAYLISVLLLRERDASGHLDIRSFYIRRALRIWPLYYAVIGLAWLLAQFVSGEALSLRHVLGYSFFVGNWVYMAAPISTVAAPLWSVSVEEQFYLVWPWVVRHGGERLIGMAAIVIVVLGGVACVVLQWAAPNDDWVTRNSFTRIDSIAVGAMVAVLWRERGAALTNLQRGALLVGALLGLICLAHVVNLFARPVSTPALILGWPLVALACGAILVAVIGCEGWIRQIFANPISVYLGRISFGLYALHVTALKISDEVFPDHASRVGLFVAHWLFGLALSVILAAISYRLLELPFLRLKQMRFTVVRSRPD